jgi:hypothetical protein
MGTLDGVRRRRLVYEAGMELGMGSRQKAVPG